MRSRSTGDDILFLSGDINVIVSISDEKPLHM